ncbi:MAG: aminotransferase class IV [Lysobacter sp.]|nr:aminotransferase class IV [Lysobacter sp.]
MFRGADRIDALSPSDRAYAYGDGVFETMRAHRGELPWWDRHWARLRHSAPRLGLSLPDEAQVQAEAQALLEGQDAVLKLILSRGEGGRGYAPPAQAIPSWTISRHPLPPPSPREGLTLRWCDLRVSLQPALAGMKHCNRLEQVLARAEWDDPNVHEGLLLNADGELVGATAAQVRPLNAADLARADAIFLCNAVRGILPVARLGERQWAPHPGLTGLRRRLGSSHPAFAGLDD